MNLRAAFRCFSFLALCFVVAVGAWGQVTASLRGTITDPAGAVVPGAALTLKNLATTAVRQVQTDPNGFYLFAAINPGTYQLKVEARGFRTIVKDNVELLVNVPLNVDLKLELGQMTEVVSVTGEAPLLNTSDASIGNVIQSTQVLNLPLSARNVVGLLSLQPGVTPDGYVNGGRADQANVTLDGVDVNEQQLGTAFFSVLRTTPDALQEFRVTTTNPNADQGRSSGAQIALVTKSGTNAYHGSLYEYHRNTVTSANNWFNNKAGVPRPKLLRNNFGGSLGGPIKKDRFFFFFNYEGFREAKGSTIVREVPLPTMGQGIVRYTTANGASDASCPAGTPSGVRCLTRAQISAAYLAAYGIDPGTNPAALAILADAARRYPANDTTTGDQLNTKGFRFNAPTPVRQNTAIARFDANLSDNHTAYVRLNYQSDNATAAPRFPDTASPNRWDHPMGLAVNHVWTARPTLVNSFRYGLTRLAFTDGGDSNQNLVNFRFIFQPLNYSRTLSRVTPVHNLVEDLTWIKGSHTLQFGSNIRLVANERLSFGASYDSAIINPSFYDFSGDVVTFDDDGNPIFPNVASGFGIDLRDALSSVIGRLTQYSANLNYAKSGNLLPVGTGVARKFKTQEYEFYSQDSWRIRPNLTLNYGLRWSTSTPVYEADGFQVKPTPSLSDVFERRVQGAMTGNPYNESLLVDFAGKVNNRPGYYSQDWDNFAPAVSVAWSPSFKDGVLGKIFGDRKTSIRSGFRMTYDRIGSALAVYFDLNSTLGYKLTDVIAANTFNVSDRLGPQLPGLNPNVRALPRLKIQPTLKFPLMTPADEDQRIEGSLDDRLTTPLNYSVNFAVSRELGRGFSVEAAYVGRLARNLLLTRDIMHLNNLVDPKSGVDWYTAIRQLIDLRYKDAAITSVQKIPYFENLFPGLAGTFTILGQRADLTATQGAYRRVAKSAVGGRNTTDYTFVQLLWDDKPVAIANNMFFHPQYAAFSAYSTLGESDYHSAQFTVRKRFSRDLTFDFNYTLGRSLDTASGLQTEGAYGAAFNGNPLNLDLNRGNSDFDIRHIINTNYIVGLPFGRGKWLLKDVNPVANQIIGGWQLTGIFRWNSGLPSGQPFDGSRWATNWNVQSNTVAIRKLQSSPTRTGDPNMFSDSTFAFQSYRNAYPGEVGDRNVLRYPGYVNFDLGVVKSFNLSGEQRKLIFRWDVFNLTNTQYFRGIANFFMPQDPFLAKPPSDFGKFTGIQGEPRKMQFALRFEF